MVHLAQWWNMFGSMSTESKDINRANLRYYQNTYRKCVSQLGQLFLRSL